MMKRLLFYGLLPTLCGCMGESTPTQPLTGVYTQKLVNEFGKSWDTVELKPLSGKDMYQLHYRRYSETVVDGKKWPSKYETPPPDLARYDREHQVLLIDGMPEYAVHPDSAMLTKGKGKFYKVR